MFNTTNILKMLQFSFITFFLITSISYGSTISDEFTLRPYMMTQQKPDRGKAVTGDLRKQPEGVISLGGKERDIPVVARIVSAIESKNPFIVVGGGGSGKTEQLLTAIHLTGRDHIIFDLRSWTLAQIADPEIRESLKQDTSLHRLGLGYLDSLEARIAEGAEGEPFSEEDIADIIKNDYRGKDQTLGIKYAESLLIKRELEIAEAEGVSHVAEFFGLDKRMLDAIQKGDTVLILDEFDMGILKDLADIEIETARDFLSIANILPCDQRVAIVHPPARQNSSFMQVVDDWLTVGLTEGRQVQEIDMKYMPREIEARALEMVGISGTIAERLMDDLEGTPAAYIDIIVDPLQREEIFGIREVSERVKKILSDTEATLAKNKRVVIDRSDAEVQDQIIALARGVELSPDLDTATSDKMKRTMYVFEDEEGRIQMSPIVRRVLLQEQIRNSDTIWLQVYLDQATEQVLLIALEEIEELEKGVLKNTKEENRGPGYHLTLIPKTEKQVLEEIPEIVAERLAAIDELDSVSIKGVGKRESEDGTSKTYFLVVDSPELEQLRELIPGLKDYDLHITLGFVGSDVHPSVPQKGFKTVNAELMEELELKKVDIPSELGIVALEIKLVLPEGSRALLVQDLTKLFRLQTFL